jgi:hypothetical protein
MPKPVRARAAGRRPNAAKEHIMYRTRPRRLAILLAAAAAVAVLMAGVALGSAGRGKDRDGSVESSAFRMRIPDIASIDVPHVKWTRSDDNDVITVDGKKCPRSHPHKVGSSLSSSWTDDNGRVTHRTHRRTVCER